MVAKQVTGRAKGGVAAAKKMTAEQKQARAQAGALARWGAIATHKGNFKDEFGVDVECYVLNDPNKTAVISQIGMGRTLGLSSRGSSFPRFLSSAAMSEYLGAEVRRKLENPIKFQWDSVGAGDRPIHGYDAALLIELCQAILRAQGAGRLASNQSQVAAQAAIIIGASAKSGIKGLVYALAGYNPTAHEVIEAFKMYVKEEAREYEKEFPPQLYEHWYRLYELAKPERGRPWKAKDLTIKHVYRPLARSNGKVHDLLKALRAQGDDRNAKLHQFLSELGVKALRTQVGQLLGIAGISKSSAEYERHVMTLFGDQPELPGIE